MHSFMGAFSTCCSICSCCILPLQRLHRVEAGREDRFGRDVHRNVHVARKRGGRSEGHSDGGQLEVDETTVLTFPHGLLGFDDARRFVLVDTSHPGNIGAVARAMKNMGLSDLVLVADPQTLGQMRPQLHKETLERLRGEVAKTLTNSPLEDITAALQ